MTNPKTEKINVPDDDRVDVFVPFGSSKDDPNLFIGINGVNYILPKGKTSRVPKFVADEYRRSQDAETAQAARIAEISVG